MLKPIHVVLLLSVTNILAYLDRYIMAAVLPAVQAEFGLSNVAAGLLVSAFLVGTLPLMPLFGYWGDRTNRIKLMIFGVIGWTLATAASGLAPNYILLFLARVAVGSGEASFLPNAPPVIKGLSDTLKQANARLAIYHASVPLGSAAGLAVGGFFAQHYGWRSAFYCGALLGVPMLAALYFAKPKIKLDPVQKDAGSFITNVKTVFSYANYCKLVLGFALLSFILSGYITWLPKLGVMRGVEIREVTSILGLITVVASVVGNFLGGYFGARATTGEPSVTSLSRFSAAVALLASVPAIIAFQTTDMRWTLGLLLLAETMIFTAIAPTFTGIMEVLPKKMHATGIAIALFAVQCMGALTAPVVIGAIADITTLDNALSMIALCAICAGLIWWRIKETKLG